MISTDLLRDKMGAIGIAFAANASGVKDVDPESVILDVIKSGEFPESKASIKLLLSLLLEHGEVFHVERIKGQIGDLSPYETAILGALALKLSDAGDQRWKTICVAALKRLGSNKPKWGPTPDEGFHLKRSGSDDAFKKFGITCPKVEPADLKKVRSKLALIENNIWFRNRVAFGVNMRADAISAVTLANPANASQLKKALHCSTDCAYRNWKDLMQFRGTTIQIKFPSPAPTPKTDT